MAYRDAQRSQQHAVLPAALFRAWVACAKPGERLEYDRGLLALDRIKGTNALNEAERRKLAAVADHARALAEAGKLHLLQERHGEGNYSYRAVARTPARSIKQVLSRFSVDQRSENPRA
jgi:hypothetical protein